MFYYVARFVMFLFLRLLFKVRVEGGENIPETGGVVICSNHLNNMDPLVVGTSIKRKLHFMAKKELFENKFLKMLFTGLAAFPVDRGKNDLAAYKKAIDLLKGGAVMGVFVQGKRIDDGGVQEAKSGAALFALKSGAEIVPAFIKSDYGIRNEVTLKIGPPLDLEKYRGVKIKSDVINDLTESIIKGINSLSMN